MNQPITEFDPGEYLETAEVRAAFLQQALDTGDMDIFLKALGEVAKAEGMSAVAERSGLGRARLYKAIGPNAQPRFDTISKLTKALGLTLTLSPERKVA